MKKGAPILARGGQMQGRADECTEIEIETGASGVYGLELGVKRREGRGCSK